MTAVTGAVVALLRDAYQRRDKVGVVTFRGSGASVVLPPTASGDTAPPRPAVPRTRGRAPPRPAPDGKPLDAALDAARGLAREAGPGRGGAAMSTVVVDCESGPVR